MITTDTMFTFESMGTVISVTSAAPIPQEAREAIEEEFQRRDDLFTLYRHSQATDINDKILSLEEADQEYVDALSQASQWQDATNGAFSIDRPEGGVDLSGIVKALAIEAAGKVLELSLEPRQPEVTTADAGTNWCINAGGDVLVSGRDRSKNQQWTVGIVDPDNREQLVSQVALTEPRCAVATSGSSERGKHIWSGSEEEQAPQDESQVGSFAQVTVVANDIITADVLATAIVAGGSTMLDRACSEWDIDVLAFADDGRVWATAACRN